MCATRYGVLTFQAGLLRAQPATAWGVMGRLEAFMESHLQVAAEAVTGVMVNLKRYVEYVRTLLSNNHICRDRIHVYMSDLIRVFDEGLQRLAKMDMPGFEACFRLVSDLTRIAVYADYKQGVFVAEVLEGIFSQVGPLLETYDVPKEDSMAIQDTIRQGLFQLSSVYKSDTVAAYETLADLRLAATKFQFKCYTTWSRLPKQSNKTRVGAA